MFQLIAMLKEGRNGRFLQSWSFIFSLNVNSTYLIYRTQNLYWINIWGTLTNSPNPIYFLYFKSNLFCNNVLNIKNRVVLFFMNAMEYGQETHEILL
jgi:hypothetical protein